VSDSGENVVSQSAPFEGFFRPPSSRVITYASVRLYGATAERYPSRREPHFFPVDVVKPYTALPLTTNLILFSGTSLTTRAGAFLFGTFLCLRQARYAVQIVDTIQTIRFVMLYHTQNNGLFR
jgi:hypothetical protein